MEERPKDRSLESFSIFLSPKYIDSAITKAISKPEQTITIIRVLIGKDGADADGDANSVLLSFLTGASLASFDVIKRKLILLILSVLNSEAINFLTSDSIDSSNFLLERILTFISVTALITSLEVGVIFII